MENANKMCQLAKDRIAKCMFTMIIIFKKEAKILTTYTELVQLKENAP